MTIEMRLWIALASWVALGVISWVWDTLRTMCRPRKITSAERWKERGDEVIALFLSVLLGPIALVTVLFCNGDDIDVITGNDGGK